MSSFQITVSPIVNAITVADSSPTVEVNGTVSTATGAAGGDLSGNYPNPTVDGLQGRSVSSTAPTNGQFLGWNNSLSQWEPTTQSGGSGTVTQVSSGTGLTGGPITTSGTLAIDFASSGSATAGKAVEATDSRLSNSRAPTGSAGGALSGSYPNPSLAPIATDRLLGNALGVASAPSAVSVTSPLAINSATNSLEFQAPGSNGQVYYRSGGVLATTAKFAFAAGSSTITLTDPTTTSSAAYSWDYMIVPEGFYQQTAALGSFFLGDHLGLGNGTMLEVNDSASAFNFTADTITRNGLALITEDDAVALAAAL